MAGNVVLLMFVGAMFVFSGASSDKHLSSPGILSANAEDSATNPLDELSSADIAVNVARVSGLDEANSVTNKADTANAGLDITSADDKLITKPQIVSTSLKSKDDIQIYKVVEGDTIPSIAAKFGINSETVRNSNNLRGDTVTAGTDLVISPVNGLVYTVQAGDTPQSIAARYRANTDQIIAFNDAELSGGFKVGERIVVPDGLQPIPQRYSFASGGFSYGAAPIYRSNAYDYGWCTWHAANRRAQIGRPIPANLGNAISWLGLARRAGLPTGDKPQSGAVLYHTNLGGLGHVAFVESVNPDGSFLVSDMNYPTWGRVTYRTVPASETGNYRFIY
ncbi:LysM peptidoglycan-binding domain-containing protein [Candidatus Saccharibacteria bacterium]|nr:LysM peptidoglycan-binding domain-containing protein [Candidatus Saccharibacteria bacterium]